MAQSIEVQTVHGCYVPPQLGSKELAWQEPVTVVTTHTGARVRIDGTRSELITSHGSYDVSDEVPELSRGDHEALVAYWTAKAEGWAADAARITRELPTGSVEMPEAA